MAVSPVLVVNVEDSVISIRARLYDDYSEHEIVLNSVLVYWWNNNMSPAIKFLELLDSVIKRTINELIPHKMLNLKYDVCANQILDDASELDVTLNSVVADDVGFKIEGDTISLKGIRKVDEDFKPKEFTTSFDLSIETPDEVLDKYLEMKED